MKNFLAVYLGSTSGVKMEAWRAMDEAKRKAAEASGMKAWMDWMVAHKDAVVTDGGPLGKTKRVDAKGVSDATNALTGYVVIRAATHEDAAKMFVDHPHFTNFPGESVEIVECLPMPTM